MAKNSKFRRWVNEVWFQYKDEVESYLQAPKTNKEYFHLYKWWLKEKFKKEVK